MKTTAQILEGESRPQIESMVCTIRHVVDLIGSDHVVLGLDQFVDVLAQLDPKFLVENLETIDKLPHLTSALLESGVPEATVTGILGGNWLRFLRTALPR